MYLEKANNSIRLLYPKNKDSKEYYKTDVGNIISTVMKVHLVKFLDHNTTTIVAELVTLCYKLNIFSSPSEDELDASDEVNVTNPSSCDTCEKSDKGFFFDSTRENEEEPSASVIKADLEKTRFVCSNFTLLNYQKLKDGLIANCLNHRELMNNLLRCIDGKQTKNTFLV